MNMNSDPERFNWLPVPILLTTIFLLYTFNSPEVYISTYFLTFLNIIFIGLSFLLISFVASKSFHLSGYASLLFIGYGAFTLGIAGFSAGFFFSGDRNSSVTVYNLGCFFSAIFHVIGSVIALSGDSILPVKHRNYFTIGLFGFIFLAFLVLWIVTPTGTLPLFYNSQEGFSTIRQALIFASFLLFTLSGSIYWLIYCKTRLSFFSWYSIGLLLMAVGMSAILLINSMGNLLNWCGRFAQYLGGFYLFIALYQLVKEEKSNDRSWYVALASFVHMSDIIYNPKLKSSTEAIVILDSEDRVITWNPGAEHLLNFTYTSVLGKKFYDLDIFPREFNTLLQRKDKQPKTNQSLSIEVRMKKADGVIFPAELTLIDNDSNVQKTIVLIKDISERKKFEEELCLANKNLEFMVESLSGAEQNIRFRIANRIHDDLQQILTATSMNLQKGMKDLDGLPQIEHLRAAHDLLKKSIEESRMITIEIFPPILQHSNLFASLEWLVKWMRDKHDLQTILIVESESIAVSDQVKYLIFEIMKELLFNTVKHSGVKKCLLTIDVLEGYLLRVIVRDHGVGCNPDNIEKWKGGSSGFGLYGIIRRLEMLGGSFTCNTKPGKGFSLTLTIPCQIEEVQGRKHKVEKLAETFGFGKQGISIDPLSEKRKIKLLLADDHQLVRKGIANILEMEEDFEIISEAKDGRSAYELSMQMKPDVVLMDVNMPVINGIEATLLIKKEIPSIQIIGLSMNNDEDTAHSMKEAGASAFLQKDGDIENLFRTIRGVVKGLINEDEKDHIN